MTYRAVHVTGAMRAGVAARQGSDSDSSTSPESVNNIELSSRDGQDANANLELFSVKANLEVHSAGGPGGALADQEIQHAKLQLQSPPPQTLPDDAAPQVNSTALVARKAAVLNDTVAHEDQTGSN